MGNKKKKICKEEITTWKREKNTIKGSKERNGKKIKT